MGGGADAGHGSDDSWLVWTRCLSGAGAEAIPSVRGWARKLVADLSEELVVDVLLVVVELVTNALEHGGGARSVRLSRSPGRGLLHVEVDDSNLAELTPGVSRFGPPANRGRGLTLIAHIVQDWGVRRGESPGRKVVWATLAAASDPGRAGAVWSVAERRDRAVDVDRGPLGEMPEG